MSKSGFFVFFWGGGGGGGEGGGVSVFFFFVFFFYKSLTFRAFALPSNLLPLLHLKLTVISSVNIRSTNKRQHVRGKIKNGLKKLKNCVLGGIKRVGWQTGLREWQRDTRRGILVSLDYYVHYEFFGVV